MSSKRSASARRGGENDGDNSRVRVVVRIRPLNSRERAAGHKHILQGSDHHITVWDPACFETASRPEFAVLDPACWSREFAFDRCLWSHDVAIANYASQSNVYDEIGQPVLDWILNGYNCCVFAFGQTGAGKSFTMMGDVQDGDPSSYGLIPRICFSLFDAIDEIAADGLETSVIFSHMEIYNEFVRDLMAPRAPRGQDVYLKVREHPSRGVFVSNLTTIKVTNFDDVMSLVAIGDKNRTIGATNSNAHSSRSHAIVTLTVIQRSRNSPKNGLPTSALQQKVGRVHLVDLAGSERVTFSGAQGKRLKEANHINRSLSVLGDVIKCLGDSKGGAKRAHIPYRNSTLTMVLKDSLGGNAHAVMLTAVSPSSYDYEETVSTLKYADRAKRVHMRVEANVTSGLLATDSSAVELVPLLQAEVRKLREMLTAQQLKQGPNAGLDYYRSDVVEEMRERVKELETQLAEREMLIESLALMRQEQLERVMFNPAYQDNSARDDGINAINENQSRDREFEVMRRPSVSSSQNSVRWADEVDHEYESAAFAPTLTQQITPERLRQRGKQQQQQLRTDVEADNVDDRYDDDGDAEVETERQSMRSPGDSNVYPEGGTANRYNNSSAQPRSPSAEQLRKSLTASLSLSGNGFGSLLLNANSGAEGADSVHVSREDPLKLISTRISGELNMSRDGARTDRDRDGDKERTGGRSSSTSSFDASRGGVNGQLGAVPGSPQRSLPVVVLSEDAVDVTLPRVINLNQDPLFSECLVYYIPEGEVCAGSLETESDILLSGPDICAKHCTITHDRSGTVRLQAAEGALIFVNGDILPSTGNGRLLQHYDRIAFGRFHLFRFEAGGKGGLSARPTRGGRGAKRLGVARSGGDTEGGGGALGVGGKTEQPPGWEFAQGELLMKNDALVGLRPSTGGEGSVPGTVGTSALPSLLSPPQAGKGSSRLPGGAVAFDTYKDMMGGAIHGSGGSGRKRSSSSTSSPKHMQDTGSPSSASLSNGSGTNSNQRRSPTSNSNGKPRRDSESGLPPMPATLPMSVSYAKYDSTISPSHRSSPSVPAHGTGTVISTAEAVAQREEDERLAEQYWNHLTRVAEGKEIMHSTKDGGRIATAPVAATTTTSRPAVTGAVSSVKENVQPAAQVTGDKDRDRGSSSGHGSEATAESTNVSGNRSEMPSSEVSPRDAGRNSGKDTVPSAVTSTGGTGAAGGGGRANKSIDNSSSSAASSSSNLRDRIKNVVQQAEARPVSRSWGTTPSSTRDREREKEKEKKDREKTRASVSAAQVPPSPSASTAASASSSTRSNGTEQQRQRYGAANVDIDRSFDSAIEEYGSKDKGKSITSNTSSNNSKHVSGLSSAHLPRTPPPTKSQTQAEGATGRGLGNDFVDSSLGGAHSNDDDSTPRPAPPPPRPSVPAPSSGTMPKSSPSSSSSGGRPANLTATSTATDKSVPPSSSASVSAPASFEKEALALQEELAQMQRTLQDRMQRYQILTTTQFPNTNTNTNANDNAIASAKMATAKR